MKAPKYINLRSYDNIEELTEGKIILVSFGLERNRNIPFIIEKKSEHHIQLKKHHEQKYTWNNKPSGK